jgi:predicted enzyme related to lactoylglutathione lyase
MSQTPGSIGWTDLTVPDAEKVRDFYAAVTGWTPSPVSMGDYSDYTMSDAAGNPAAGICHRRGPNADLPPVWLVYIVVADLTAALASCQKQGGEVLSGPRSAGGGQFAVIRDPAGAIAGLYQAG